MPDRLPPDLEQFVQQEIAQGKYQSTAEVIRAALRLLQAREAQLRNGQSSHAADVDPTFCSSDEVCHAISQALATGEFGLARQLAMDGAKRYPDDTNLQKWAHVLMPPTVTHRGQIQSPSLKASRAWLKAHWNDYLDQWVAVRDGQLVHASRSFDEVAAHVDDPHDTLITKVY